MPSFVTSAADLVSGGPILQVFIGPSREFLSALGAHASAPSAHPATALVDTGAESTVINPQTVRMLGIQPVGIVAMHTPTTVAPVRCRQFHINVYFSHEFAVENILAIEAPMTGQPFQCLIGRDVLRQGTLVYSGRENQFSLTF